MTVLGLCSGTILCLCRVRTISGGCGSGSGSGSGSGRFSVELLGGLLALGRFTSRFVTHFLS